MTQRNENRIWRALFLTAIVGVGIAATARDASNGEWVGVCTKNNNFFALRADGNLYRAAPVPGSSVQRWAFDREPEVTGRP